MNLIQQLENYTPWNLQEAKDKAILLECLYSNEDLYSRTNTNRHFTVSAWVVDHSHTKVLMAYHNIYNSWAWLGGHADGNSNLLEVALREVQEESNLKQVKPLSEDIYSVEILAVEGHMKQGEYISSHLHFNVTYLLEADAFEPISPKYDENSNVAWFSYDQAVCKSSEPWFKTYIYPKLNAKLNAFLAGNLL